VPIFAKRILFIVAGVFAAAAIILLCINLYLQSSGVQQRIRDAAVKSLGSEVKIQSTVYTPWNGLVLRGISIPDPSDANLNFVEAAALRIRFAHVSLLRGRFAITECTLFEPKFLIRQLENGDWLMPLPAPEPEVPAAPKETSPAKMKGPSFRAELQRFRLRSGSIVFVNAKSRAIVALEKVNISGQIVSPSQVAGIFEIGKTDLFNSLKPRKIGGTYTWDGRVLEMPDIEGSLAGGKLFAKYRVESNGQPTFLLGLQLTGVLLRKLAEEAQVDPGKTDGSLRGSMNLTGDPRNSDSIAGEGHFELVAAKLKPVEFLVKLGELLQIDELQLLDLSDARVDLTIGNQRVHLENIIFKSDNLILFGKGPIRFNGKMNIDARLLFNLKLQNQLKGVLSQNLTDSEDPNYRELAFTVTGRIDNPKTDLLDKLIGVKVGQDIGGMLMNIFRSSVPRKPQDKQQEQTIEN
jgi:AsmA-like C-terminal region